MKTKILILFMMIFFFINCNEVEKNIVNGGNEPPGETVKEEPVIVYFMLEPEEITDGQKTVLKWKTEKATVVRIKFWKEFKAVELEGERVLGDYHKDFTFEIEVSNEYYTIKDSVTLKVKPDFRSPEIVYFKCEPNPIVSNQTTFLSYKVNYSKKVEIMTWATWQTVNNDEGGWSIYNRTASQYMYIRATNDNGVVTGSLYLVVK